MTDFQLLVRELYFVDSWAQEDRSLEAAYRRKAFRQAIEADFTCRPISSRKDGRARTYG